MSASMERRAGSPLPTSSAVRWRTRTPLARARLSCSRSDRWERRVSSYVRGSQVACRPMSFAGMPTMSRNRRSTAKKTTRRPSRRAASIMRSVTSRIRSGAHTGAPATTQALPVSMYETQASPWKKWRNPRSVIWNAVEFQPHARRRSRTRSRSPSCGSSSPRTNRLSSFDRAFGQARERFGGPKRRW